MGCGRSDPEVTVAGREKYQTENTTSKIKIKKLNIKYKKDFKSFSTMAGGRLQRKSQRIGHTKSLSTPPPLCVDGWRRRE